MSGALCRRQKASFYNRLLCGLPTTSTDCFAQVWTFLFSLLKKNLTAFTWSDRWFVTCSLICTRGEEARLLNSRERCRIGFHDTGWCKAEGICKLCDRDCFLVSVSFNGVAERSCCTVKNVHLNNSFSCPIFY